MVLFHGGPSGAHGYFIFTFKHQYTGLIKAVAILLVGHPPTVGPSAYSANGWRC